MASSFDWPGAAALLDEELKKGVQPYSPNL